MCMCIYFFSIVTSFHVGCEEIIYELIKKGAVVNATNYHGSSPLHYACQRGHLNGIVSLKMIISIEG